MLPRATHTRSAREAAQGKQGGRTLEIQRLIGRSLRSVTELRGLGERTITLDCDVLQADGGTRCAGITGACVALAMALAKLVREEKIPRWPLREDGRRDLGRDLRRPGRAGSGYAEDSEADVDCNVVGTASGAFVEIQGTAERRPFSEEQLTELLALAKKGLERCASSRKRRWRSAPDRGSTCARLSRPKSRECAGAGIPVVRALGVVPAQQVPAEIVLEVAVHAVDVVGVVLRVVVLDDEGRALDAVVVSLARRASRPAQANRISADAGLLDLLPSARAQRPRACCRGTRRRAPSGCFRCASDMSAYARPAGIGHGLAPRAEDDVATAPTRR